MNLTEIKKYLDQVTDSGNADFVVLAQSMLQVIEQLESSSIRGNEAVEILNDLQHQIEIMDHIKDLQFQQKLNAVLNTLIAIAAKAI